MERRYSTKYYKEEMETYNEINFKELTYEEKLELRATLEQMNLDAMHIQNMVNTRGKSQLPSFVNNRPSPYANIKFPCLAYGIVNLSKKIRQGTAIFAEVNEGNGVHIIVMLNPTKLDDKETIGYLNEYGEFKTVKKSSFIGLGYMKLEDLMCQIKGTTLKAETAKKAGEVKEKATTVFRKGKKVGGAGMDAARKVGGVVGGALNTWHRFNNSLFEDEDRRGQ